MNTKIIGCILAGSIIGFATYVISKLIFGKAAESPIKTIIHDDFKIKFYQKSFNTITNTNIKPSINVDCDKFSNEYIISGVNNLIVIKDNNSILECYRHMI